MMAEEVSKPKENKKEPEKVRTKNIGHYVLGKTLGEGTFGKVKLGVHIFTGEKVAVKILEKDKILEVSDVERVAREIHILKLIRHQNIIQLYEIIETGKQLYLIMEYASGGELFEYIVNKGKVREPEAARFFHQIINGVNYLHHLGIVHRDLKPENLLLDHNKTIKIVDFGLSNTYQQGEKLKTACGSPCYAAPEMIAGKSYHGSNVDIWSCGVILFALICGYLPFEDPNTAKLYKKILTGDFAIPKYVSNGARDLMKCILSTNPEKRYKAEDIRQHAWVKQYNKNTVFSNNFTDDDIPIYQNILDMLEEFRFDKLQAEKYIKANKHNHETTTYYLLLKKYERTGKKLQIKREEDLPEDERNQTQPPLYPHNLSVSQKIKTDYLPKSQLNQTLPITTRIIDPLTISINPVNLNMSKHHIYMETSRAEQQAGINVSYDNSFTAIKRDIQKTVGDAKAITPENQHTSDNKINIENQMILEGQFTPEKQLTEDVDSKRPSKLITDELPPNKPYEAIKISESVKVNERENKDLAQNKELSFKTFEHQQDSVTEENNWQNFTTSQINNNQEISEANSIQKAGVSFNTVREQEKSASATDNYSTKPKALANYGASVPKKKGHIANFSYSSRPKTTCYLSNGKQSFNSKKNQANSFLTQSMDTTKTPKNIEGKQNKVLDKYEESAATSGKKSPVIIEDASSSARPSRYTRVTKPYAKTAIPQVEADLKSSGIIESENNNYNDSTQEMKTYRGPFSVSCSTTKDPAVVMNDMVRSLDLYSVSFQRTGNYSIKCQKSSVKFEMELTKMENLEFVYIVRILRTNGDIAKYREVASRILNSMSL